MENSGLIPRRSTRWGVVCAVFAVVLVVQLWLVARAGTDVPFMDQWDVEGRWLYPAWRQGTLEPMDLFRAYNGHRIFWTHALNLSLFAANGQWDPLVQLVVNAFFRAGCAALLAGMFSAGAGTRGRLWIAAGVTLVFLPQIGWHNALWGFQSQVYWALGFSLCALFLLSGPDLSGNPRRIGFGVAAGIAAMLAMGAGLLVPAALLGLAVVRIAARRSLSWAGIKPHWPVAVLVLAAVALRAGGGGVDELRAKTAGDFFNALGRSLAWPHTGSPWAAVALNAPWLTWVWLRLSGKSSETVAGNFLLALGGWGMAVAAAAAWTRGGGGEFAQGVPSRYADFFVVLPIVNAGCLVLLLREAGDRARRPVRGLAAAWGVFFLVGWGTLSIEAMGRIIVPRMRDRDAPVRLIRSFQQSGGDAAVYAGQPRLLTPHPDLESVRRVLADPRMAGALPPCLQPEVAPGPLSRLARGLIGRTE